MRQPRVLVVQCGSAVRVCVVSGFGMNTHQRTAKQQIFSLVNNLLIPNRC